MDQHLLFLINQKWTNPVLDWLLAILSCLDFWVPILALAAFWFILKRGIRGQTFVLLCILGVGVNETLISKPLKTWTNKPRPHEAVENVRRVDLGRAKPRLLALAKPLNVSFSGPPSEKVERGRSFPSSHVLNSVTLGLISALCFRAWPMLLLPFFMAWSRVYTGAHWPSDVFFSLCIGSGVTLTLLWLLEKLWRSRISMIRPDWAAQLPTLVFPSRP